MRLGSRTSTSVREQSNCGSSDTSKDGVGTQELKHLHLCVASSYITSVFVEENAPCIYCLRVEPGVAIELQVEGRLELVAYEVVADTSGAVEDLKVEVVYRGI